MPSLATICPQIPLQSLVSATNGFSDETLLSSSAFRSLYSGVLPDGTLCVVRLLKGCSDAVFEETITSISRIRHPTVTLLMGFNSDTSNRFIVYEFMQGGSFSDRMNSLKWEHTLAILDNTATALSHSLSKTPPVFHGQLKSSKVMLDEHGLAKLSDLGLYRLLPGPPLSPTLESEIAAFRTMMMEVPLHDWPENVAQAFNNLRMYPPLSFRLIISDLRRIAAMEPGPIALFGLSWDGVVVGEPAHVDRGTQTDYAAESRNRSVNQCCSISLLGWSL